MNMHKIFNVGDEIGGYCEGFFGRDDYENKTCVFLTPKYALFEYSNGAATVLNYTKGLEDHAGVDKWPVQPVEKRDIVHTRGSYVPTKNKIPPPP